MATTPNLGLPFLAPAQAQKHVTVNEGLAALDALVQCAVLAMHRNDPPSAPAEGDRYLVGPAPDADWSGQAGRLAAFRNGGWAFAAPKPGWRLYDLATETLYALGSGLAWTALSGPGATGVIQNATRFGLGTAADAATPFAAKLDAALWTARTAAEGGSGDLRIALNKTAAARDAGHLFQSGFVTRALAGLFGSNRFRVAVSADGATFRDALSIDDATGIVDQPRLPRFRAHTNFDNYAAIDVWTRIAINVADANDQGAFDAATNRFTAPADGLYVFGATLMHRINVSTAARMRGRLVRNGATELAGSFGEISGANVTLATALWLQTAAPLAAGDTVELQGSYRAADGYFAAVHTSFWGFKAG
jgi:hypothetical protein